MSKTRNSQNRKFLMMRNYCSPISNNAPGCSIQVFLYFHEVLTLQQKYIYTKNKRETNIKTKNIRKSCLPIARYKKFVFSTPDLEEAAIFKTGRFSPNFIKSLIVTDLCTPNRAHKSL